ncbi:MAG TPA: class E sortase [Acidimicrobiia bacterium]|nr:class E sortase [Acidimicrobiia bacterium]
MTDTPLAVDQPSQVKNPSRLRDGSRFFFDSLRARPVARRILSGVSIVTAVVAIGMLAYPLYTNWQQDRLQSKLAIQLHSPENKAAYAAGHTPEGDALTRLVIPTLKVDTVVVEGTGASALRAGAGHYPNTPLPGEEGNVAIAGHRTTYGKPFANVDRMKVGDEILLETPLGQHVYRVTRPPFVVANNDFTVISQTPGRSLTLTTCHPRGSARQRLIIRAEKV